MIYFFLFIIIFSKEWYIHERARASSSIKPNWTKKWSWVRRWNLALISNDVTWLERDGRRGERVSRYSASYWKVMFRVVLTLLTNPVVPPSSTISNNEVHESVFASRLRSRTATIFLQRLKMHRYPFHTRKNCVHYLSLFILPTLSHTVWWLLRSLIYIKYLHESIFCLW